MEGDLALDSSTLKAVLIDSADYTYSAAHDFLDDVAGAAIVGTAQTIGSKTFGTVAAGVFDGADISLPSVTGDVSEAILIYMDSGSAATSYLILYIDSATGLPVTPNGGNIAVAWSASGIGKI